MRRKHLTMGIDVDASALGLFQKQLEVVQIVSGNDDKRSLFHTERNLSRLRYAKGFRICTVEQLHTGQVNLSKLHDQRKQLLHIPVLCQRK